VERAPGAKATGALRTIGEVAQETGVQQHVLRFWETRFPQLRPLQRAGGRRYYRAEDVALVRRIQQLLDREGYSIRGAQQLLAADPGTSVDNVVAREALQAIRDRLAGALAADAAQDAAAG
jgi:DNA-binding transcriptional MerR regulator